METGERAVVTTEATPLLLGGNAGPKYAGAESRSGLWEEQLEAQDQAQQGRPSSAGAQREEDGEEELHILVPTGGSARKTFFNIVISLVGTGVLGLPYTFMRSGWLLGSVALLLSGALAYLCMMRLCECRKKLEVRGVRVDSYSKVGWHACGDAGERTVDALVLVSQGGCCVAYLIFISQNLKSIFCSAAQQGYSCTGAEFVLLALPLQIALSWVRSLTGLVPFSIVADIANLLAMGLVIRADLQNFQDFSGLHAFTGLINVPFALGVACYCYEGFAMTLPLEASMKNPRRFPFVLALAMVSVTVLYLSFGLIGYFVFKNQTKEIITLNLPNDWTSIAVKLGLCLGLYFTYPVMMHPVHEIVENNIAKFSLYQQYIEPHPKLSSNTKKALRCCIVILSGVIAIRVPAFAIFISLIGSSVCAMLAFVLPGFFHMILADDGDGVQKLMDKGSDILLVLFGILFAVYGTADAVSKL